MLNTPVARLVQIPKAGPEKACGNKALPGGRRLGRRRGRRLIRRLQHLRQLLLQLLAEGYSNSAIAEKLVVADTTVRTHLRHINTKLNASSRTQAVALARKLRLIP